MFLFDGFALFGVVWGFGWSYAFFEGITKTTQYLELIGIPGFLVGTYLLAKDPKDVRGYWCFVLMNLATGLLFAYKGRTMFAVQQIFSILFVLDAGFLRSTGKTLVGHVRAGFGKHETLTAR